jgi:hypothetical protein
VLIIELLSTPSHITLLGGVDDNRVRRIYADSHQHPEDPDLTQDGHSIGHWEGDALVRGTAAIMPQAFIAIIEAVGIPNNGDMHIIERLHLAGAECPARRPGNNSAESSHHNLEPHGFFRRY